MTAQYLEFVRQQLIVATADLSGATKGQLIAFAENAQFTATARSRGRKKVYSEVKQKMVNPDGPPMSGSQSRAKGSSIALVLPVEYSTASWRRALLSLEDHQKAWLLWNYSDNIRWEHQETITRWAWGNSTKSWPACALQRKQSIACANLSGWPRRMSKPSWQGGRRMNIRRWRSWLV